MEQRQTQKGTMKKQRRRRKKKKNEGHEEEEEAVRVLDFYASFRPRKAQTASTSLLVSAAESEAQARAFSGRDVHNTRVFSGSMASSSLSPMTAQPEEAKEAEDAEASAMTTSSSSTTTMTGKETRGRRVKRSLSTGEIMGNVVSEPRSAEFRGRQSAARSSQWARMRSEGRRRSQQRCSYCNGIGHNRSTCPEIPESMRAKKTARRCSHCGSTDHDLRLCPLVHLDPALPVEQRLEFVRRVMKRNQRFSFPSYRRLVKHIEQYVTQDGEIEAKMKVPYQPDVARELYEQALKASTVTSTTNAFPSEKSTPPPDTDILPSSSTTTSSSLSSSSSSL